MIWKFSAENFDTGFNYLDHGLTGWPDICKDKDVANQDEYQCVIFTDIFYSQSDSDYFLWLYCRVISTDNY